ncbi:peptidoglycan-binding protein [Quadrisphaera sp. DSM 44207]|uniref:peptidoglycan-binding domain-containing protein n=1 Tax=Quadrisphaera sp. DSM 44207 TaxID=1881057 RepID=UPI0008850E85|nr:peptidoglycan-binding protein [Quadrisphaera sp. DSM 44207]SDQ15577.1 Peptidoglycan-binding (PGRP) domain of peptidoglycan hydrolases-containing protein [Quadrisphaera sp. DSM 44207]
MRTTSWKTTTALAACAGLVLISSPAAVAAGPAARSGTATATVTAAAAAAASQAPLLEAGSRGPQVREWQALLNRLVAAGQLQGPALAEDGVFGPGTQSATKRAQARVNLVQDGVVGPRTRTAVSEVAAASGIGGIGASGGEASEGRRLQQGARGDDVREWQRIVNTGIDLGRVDHPRIAQDGSFGPRTRSATTALQRAANVPADGVVGPVTREAAGWLLEG